MGKIVFLLLAIAFRWGCEQAAAENADVAAGLTVLSADRHIDITTQLIKQHVNFEIENNDKAPIKYFLYAVEKREDKSLSWIEASVGRDDNKKVLKLSQVTVKGSDSVNYKVELATPLNVGQKAKFRVDTIFSHLLNPFPTHIPQKEQQLVVYEGSAVVLSPYVVKLQNTLFKIPPPHRVESFTKHAPSKHDGDSISYGPYENVEANKRQELRIHYENDSPFLTVTKMTRLLEISHWGNIAVEETLEIVHTGAVLKGSFSRLDFQRDHRERQPCVKSFKTLLPAASKDVYYRDEIGNISTSNLRQLEDAVELEIRPRFPLFGGWQTNYYIGYNVPSYEYLFASGSRFALKMRFIDHIFDNFLVDEFTLKVILPETAKDIKFEAPFQVKRSPDEVHYTYLDYVGRPVVIAHKNNLVESHIQDFELHYTFDRVKMLCEPFMIIISLYILFLVVIVWMRLDFTISKDAATESRLKVAGFVESINDLHSNRSNAYEQHVDAINKYRSSKDATALNNSRKKIENDLKTWTQQISDIQALLKNESADAAEKVNEVQRLDRAIKDQLTAWAQQAERLVSGKLQKQQYAEAEKTSRAKIDELKEKIESILFTL